MDLFGFEESKKIETLKDIYLTPPFSLLDAKKADWRKRRNKFIRLGIKSETSRESIKSNSRIVNNWGDDKNKYLDQSSTASIFDPALCELIYNWFCPENGTILDPFAGGSVRGIVANYLGYNYIGIELRQEQVDNNKEQALDILPINKQPQWYCGDSEKILDDLIDKYDLSFTCPPYFNLEKYSDLPEDLSNMDYKSFKNKYKTIIEKTILRLKNDGFLVIVINDIRDSKGFYIGLTNETINICLELGVKLYNELIYMQELGPAALKCVRPMRISRKVTKIHQHVLVFKKINSFEKTEERGQEIK